MLATLTEAYRRGSCRFASDEAADQAERELGLIRLRVSYVLVFPSPWPFVMPHRTWRRPW